MIPYFQIQSFNIGPIPIQIWGLMVALGFFVGLLASIYLAKQRGQKPDILWDLVTWVILGAAVFSRLFHVFLYEPAYYLQDPIRILSIWQGGYSIMGGFVGAVLVGYLFLRKKKVDVWAYADTAVFGLPLGLFIGRIGCFLIHDHPGTATDFILGVQYPDGIVRHDHGLYLSINGLLMFLLFLYLAKRKVKTGTYIITFLIWYGIIRFLFDFLRATDGAIVDSRYLHLTPAQYFSLVMVGVGIWFWKGKRR